MEKMKLESTDLTAKNIEKIAEMFPNCITEKVLVGGGDCPKSRIISK